ncbi:MAG: hypothetical protein ACT4OT_18445 [Acidobacteriota bacterium]
MAAGAKWHLRFIPHALLRMVQRGISLKAVADLFRRFVEAFSASELIIVTGPYTIFGRTEPRGKLITLRADVDVVTDESGQAHAVTVLVGWAYDVETIAVGPV